MRKLRTNSGIAARPVCKHGVKCYRRNPAHLAQEAHPADEDYLECCRAASITPEFVSIRKLFEYCDSAGVGKASKENVGRVWDTLQRLGTGLGSLEDEWEKLDDDGNGYLNFAEFVEFANRLGVSLPVGLDGVLHSSASSSEELRCGVLGCPCRSFSMRKPRCKYGADCYQTSEEHRSSFIHPGDEGWEAGKTVRDTQMCRCGHKKKLHASPLIGTKSVTYPKYWCAEVVGDQEFNQLYPVKAEHVPLFQRLVDGTYRDVTTRDRLNHCGTWMVPRDFSVASVQRNENSRLWRKYKFKKAELVRELSLAESEDGTRSEGSQALAALPEFGDYGVVLSTTVWGELIGVARHLDVGFSEEDIPDKRINEWLLFHGTSADAAKDICATDFTMRLAGSATGTLYGRGTYLAESFTKADEYAAKDDDGFFTVLLCRVLGGRVRYCDEKTPAAEELMSDCTEGLYDCILGDRIKTSGTYREFVVFDTENVYPEFILKYKRGEFFKSPSHP